MDGDFFVIGGETANDRVWATERAVYHRVDVYSPAAASWTTAPPLDIARHGIFPVRAGDKMYARAARPAAKRLGHMQTACA